MNVATSRRLLFAATSLLTVLIAGMAYASIVVQYPLTVEIEEVGAPIQFQPGSNSNSTGLSGTMTVALGSSNASASVSFQVTYQTNYIHDILRIVNSGSSTFYVNVTVTTPLSSNAISSAQMILDDGTTTYQVDLTTNDNSAEIQMDPGDEVQINFLVVITEGAALDAQPLTVDLHLLYSPTPGGTNYAP